MYVLLISFSDFPPNNYETTMGQLWDDRRIFADEHVCQELQDDEILTPPVKLRLLLVNFPEDPLQSHEFLVACGENRLDEVEHLLLRPQDPNVVDGEGKGALHIAASNGQLAVVSMCENNWKHVSRQDMLNCDLLQNWQVCSMLATTTGSQGQFKLDNWQCLDDASKVLSLCFLAYFSLSWRWFGHPSYVWMDTIDTMCMLLSTRQILSSKLVVSAFCSFSPFNQP